MFHLCLTLFSLYFKSDQESISVVRAVSFSIIFVGVSAGEGVGLGTSKNQCVSGDPFKI